MKRRTSRADAKKIATLEARIKELLEDLKARTERAEIAHREALVEAINENEELKTTVALLKGENFAMSKSLLRYTRFVDGIAGFLNVVAVVAERLPNADATELFKELYKKQQSQEDAAKDGA